MSLPQLRCGQAKLCALTADPSGVIWQALAPTWLLDTVSSETPRQRTWVKVAHDETELRVLFHAEDTEVWATHTQRDALLYEEEVVEIFLDPVGDLNGYFEIEVNPLNAVLDLVLRRSRSGWKRNFAWQCEGLQTAVRLWSGNGEAKSSRLIDASSIGIPETLAEANAWSAELSIPFASISSVPPARDWRVNFYRIDRPKTPLDSPRELSAWSPTGAPNFHVPERFGYLHLE